MGTLSTEYILRMWLAINITIRGKKSKLLKILLLFLAGGFGYYLLEVLFRGYSHWTMGLCGGICLVGIYFINRRFAKSSYTLRATLCTVLITAVEFAAGCILNLWLGLSIWDYSALPYNLLGQISLLFSSIWFFLSFGICILISAIENRKRKPKVS